MKIDYINPEGLIKARGFTQAISVSGAHKTIYVSGQDAVNEKGETVGKGSLKDQTEQILNNIEKTLNAAGAKFENIVKLNVYIVAGQNLREGFEEFQKKWGNRPNPPTVSVVLVQGLGNPEWLAEIEAVAVVPEA